MPVVKFFKRLEFERIFLIFKIPLNVCFFRNPAENKIELFEIIDVSKKALLVISRIALGVVVDAN